MTVTYDLGIPSLSDMDLTLLQPAQDHAQAADVVVVVVLGIGTCATGGSQPDVQGDCLEAEENDRTTLALPPIQRLLLSRLSALGTPLVLVFVRGWTLSYRR